MAEAVGVMAFSITTQGLRPLTADAKDFSIRTISADIDC